MQCGVCVHICVGEMSEVRAPWPTLGSGVRQPGANVPSPGLRLSAPPAHLLLPRLF